MIKAKLWPAAAEAIDVYGTVGPIKTIWKRPEIAEPDRPPGQRSLFNFGVTRVAEKWPPPEVDRARSSATWRPSGRRVSSASRTPLPRRASKPFDKPWNIVLAPSKSFEKTLETRDRAHTTYKLERIWSPTISLYGWGGGVLRFMSPTQLTHQRPGQVATHARLPGATHHRPRGAGKQGMAKKGGMRRGGGADRSAAQSTHQPPPLPPPIVHALAPAPRPGCRCRGQRKPAGRQGPRRPPGPRPAPAPPAAPRPLRSLHHQPSTSWM